MTSLKWKVSCEHVYAIYQAYTWYKYRSIVYIRYIPGIKHAYTFHMTTYSIYLTYTYSKLSATFRYQSRNGLVMEYTWYIVTNGPVRRPCFGHIPFTCCRNPLHQVACNFMACYMLSQFITCGRNPLHGLHAHLCSCLFYLFCRTIFQRAARTTHWLQRAGISV